MFKSDNYNGKIESIRAIIDTECVTYNDKIEVVFDLLSEIYYKNEEDNNFDAHDRIIHDKLIIEAFEKFKTEKFIENPILNIILETEELGDEVHRIAIFKIGENILGTMFFDKFYNKYNKLVLARNGKATCFFDNKKVNIIDKCGILND